MRRTPSPELKIKAASPLPFNMVIELANGGDGYILLQNSIRLGLNTWPALTAALEVTAEPKIVQAAITLLEKVSQQPRRIHETPWGPQQG